MENIRDVCEFILHHEYENGRSLTNHRLQSLLYFVQAKYLKTFGKPCFEDSLCVWEHGPVVLI